MADTELVSTRAAIIACISTPEALDRLEAPLRTAPDEALILAPPNAGDKTRKAANSALRKQDPHAMVVDVSDGWAGLTLTGTGARDTFSHISQLELPDTDGFVQGDVGRLAAKVVVRKPGDRITLFVPSPQAAYLRKHILALGARERSEPEPWGAS